VPINEEVLIPLTQALRPGSLASRRKDELYDIKISIKGSNTHTIAKTQIPIWDLPNQDLPEAAGGRSGGSSSSGSGGSGGGGEAAAAGGATSRPVTPQGLPNHPPPIQTRVKKENAKSACASPRAASDRLACRVATMPSRSASPRGGGGAHPEHPSILLLSKKKRWEGMGTDLDSPRVAPGGVAFSIPAYRGDDMGAASDEECPFQSSDQIESAGSLGSPLTSLAAVLTAGLRDAAAPPRHSAPSGGSPKPAAAAVAAGATQRSSTGAAASIGPAATSANASAAAAATSIPAAPSTPTAAPQSAAPATRKKGMYYAPSPGDLSRRLRSILVAGTREVSRMGWAPVRSAVSSTSEGDSGDAASSGAGAAPVTRVLASDAWGTAWKGVGGKRYVRTLESHLALTASNLEISLSLRLINLPASPVGKEAEVAIAAEGAARVLDDEDDDEDGEQGVACS